VLVAVVITLLVSMAGLAIDASRMYAFKSQLKVLTDAAALAGALELKRGSGAPVVQAQAVALRNVNRVEGFHVADLEEADVVPGEWSMQTGSFTPKAWSEASAIQVTARYAAEWSLARIFGRSSTVIVERSVASLGRASAGCVKPFILPYRALLTAAGLPTSTSLSYVLTKDDLNSIVDPTTSSTPLQFPFTQSPTNTQSSDPNIGGNFQWIEHANNAAVNQNQYLANFLQGCMTVSVGQVLYGITGDMSSTQVRSGIASMCPLPGGRNPRPGETWSCHGGPVDINIPIGNFIESSGSGANAEYTLQYIGGFRMTGVGVDVIQGWLIDLRPVVGDGFMPGPGPVDGPGVGLVQ
jgi:hypothetical protein